MAKYIRKEAKVEVMQFTGDVGAAESFVGKKLQNAGQLLGKRQVTGGTRVPHPENSRIAVTEGGTLVAGHQDMLKGVVIGDHACIDGDWIVKVGSDLKVMSERQFRDLYDQEGKRRKPIDAEGHPRKTEMPVPERVIFKTPWWPYRARRRFVDAVAYVLKALQRVLTVQDDAPPAIQVAPSLHVALAAVVARWLAALKPEPPAEPELKVTVGPKPWSTPEDLTAALQEIAKRWTVPPDLASAISKAAVKEVAKDLPAPTINKKAEIKLPKLIEIVSAIMPVIVDVEAKRTASTFKNYARIPLPLENNLARSVAIAHEQLFQGLVKASAEIGERYGYRYAGRGKLVQDRAPEDFIRELAELVGKRGPEVEALRARINAQFVAAERAWLAQFLERGDFRTRKILLSLSLDKDAVFAEKILGLRRLYLDDAVERVLGEQNDLKASFLLKLIEWAEGRAEVLDVSGLVQEMKESADKSAHFFARDQFSRFERSLTMASFEAAEAPYCEWFTSNDQRVRPAPGQKTGPGNYHGLSLHDHRIRNRKIYTIAGLLADPEFQSYNCRCGWVPRWELTQEQKTRFVV